MSKRAAGTGLVTKNGYILRGIGSSGSYKGKKYTGIRVMEHVLVATEILGRPLKGAEEVHHVNGDKTDNRPENLVICPDRAYHMLLHRRERALEACGNVDWLRCPYCKQHDAPDRLKIKSRGRSRPGGETWYHAQCARDYANARYAHAL